MTARFRFAALATASAFVLSACAGTPASGGSEEGAGGELRSGPGFDASTKTITVGTMIPVSGVWEKAQANVTGAEAYFHRATQPGGPLEGYTIEVKNLDTEYNPSVAVPLYGAAKNDVLMFDLILGSAINKALHEQIQADDMLVVSASNEDDLLHDPNTLTFGPLYGTYFAAGMDYMSSEEGMSDATYCGLLQDDHFGEQVGEGIRFAAEDLGLTLGETVSFPTGNADFTPQISKLKQAGCEVVAVGGAGAVLQNAAVKAVQLDFDAKWLAANSAYNDSLATGPAADYIKENVLFTVTGTEWGDHSVEGQKMIEEDLAEIAPDAPPVANAYQTGYVSAMITSKLLEEAIADGDLSRQHLLEVAQTELGTIDDHGLAGGELVFGSSPEERRPTANISLFAVDEGSPTGLKLKEFGFESSVAQAYNESVAE